MGFWDQTTEEEKAEDHRRRGFDGPIDQNGDAHMARTGDKPFEWMGTGSPDDKDSPRAGNAARRSRRG